MLIKVAAKSVTERFHRQNPQAIDSGPSAAVLVETSNDICHAATAHCQLLILQSFADAIYRLSGTLLRPSSPPPPPSSPSSSSGVEDKAASAEVELNVVDLQALLTLFYLLATSLMTENLGDFLLYQIIDLSFAHSLKGLLQALCSRTRVDAINLVESWQFSDRLLGSTLGRADGEVYEALFQAASLEPLNRSSVCEEGYDSLKHVFRRPLPPQHHQPQDEVEVSDTIICHRRSKL